MRVQGMTELGLTHDPGSFYKSHLCVMSLTEELLQRCSVPLGYSPTMFESD